MQWLVVVALGLIGAAAAPTMSPTTLPAMVGKSSPGGDLLNQRFAKEIKPLMT